MMTALECPTSEDLKALTLGHLSSEDSDALFHHISECELCRSELETVEDTGDSLISSLRSPDLDAEFSDEPDCQVAVAKALGALVLAGQAELASDLTRLPSSIGEYEIVRPIGRGGMGSVYLARHTKLGREVALKVLATHRLADARMRERFEAEMLAVGRLSHPNIVTAHDAREVNGTAVLVTEFVSGMDLGQLLQRTGALSVANACEIVRQIAVALSYTHQQGFVHRDIKPSNVMLSASGEVKLLDLGLARLQYGEHAGAELTGTGQAMGTADYVAPEQVTDSKTVDIRADIYALGCTLFKLLTGRAPFADEQHTTAFAKMTAHVSKTPPSLSDLLPETPRGLVSLVDSMLAKDPRQRPQTPGHVVEALAVFCKGHELVALSATAAQLEPKPVFNTPSSSVVKPATQSWMRRRVPIAAAIAAGFLGVVIGMCLSIIVVITNPDGTKSILELAEGSRVEIQDKVNSRNSRVELESAEVTLKDKMSSVGSLGSEGSFPELTPLSFAILVNPESTGRFPYIDDVALAEATKLLHASSGERPVQTEHGTWVELSDDQSVPITMQNAGKTFSLVSDQFMISWADIRGHVRAIQVSPGHAADPLGMTFDQELGAKFQQLSGRNIRNQLAIVVNGQIRATPHINSEIGERVAIAGTFEPAEIQQLQQWLFAGLVYPMEPSAKEGEPTSSNATVQAYSLSELKVDSQLAYDVVATILQGKPHVRMALDKKKDQLVIQASPAEHKLVKETLKTLSTSALTQKELNPESKHESAMKNLKQIGLAFHNFHSAYQKLPGSMNIREGSLYTGNDKKTYPFSWRVAILPFIDQDELFQEYRFDEHWDSEHNLTLLAKMPDVYRSPLASDDQPLGHTNFLGFAGDHTALGANGGHSFKDFTDGSSNTVLLVESKATVPWTKPEDISGDVSPAIFFENHPLHYLLADGSVQSMEEIDLDKLKKMITRDGGEVIEK